MVGQVAACVGAFQPAAAPQLAREYVTVGGLPLALIEGGQIRTVHPDHLGTPQKMTDASGAVVWDRVALPCLRRRIRRFG